MSATQIGSRQPRLRPDIVVMPDGETGRGRIAKDPKSRKYYRFDEVEAFILDRLDGERSSLDIQVELATWLNQEFALDEVDEFIDSLREKGLVEADGPLLPARAPQLGQKVIAALQAGGFRLRSANDPLPAGLVPSRRNPAEARQFDEALRLLHEGRFHSALRAFEEILQANPHNERAATIRALLVRAGSMAASQARAEREKPQHSKSLLYYQIPLFNPDRWFTALEPAVRFLWTRGFVAGYLAVIAVAAWIVAEHGKELIPQALGLSGGMWGIGIFAMGLLLVSLHECAHGLTCKHYGGRVSETGFLLMMLCMPAFYVDVSDAWLFREKRRRVFTGLAGPMFDLAVVAIGVILLRVAVPGPLRIVAFTAAVVSGMSFVMNLNPLLKLDGYYILSDLAGIPNLRDAASRAFGGALRRLRGLPSDGPPLARKTALLLALYGAICAVYSVLVLTILARIVFGAATRVAGLIGPVFIAALLLFLLRKPLGRMAHWLLQRLSGLSLRGALTAAAVLTGGGLLLVTPHTLRVAGPAAIDGRARTAVRAEVAGNVAQLLVTEGQSVVAGQLVARLDSSSLETALRMTRSTIDQARANLTMLARGTEPERLQQARETIQAAQAEVAHLESRADRLARLRRDGLVSADLYEQTTKDLQVQRGALRTALEESRLLQRGTAPERVSAARAEVARLEAEAEEIARKLAACDLKAPAAGQVVTPKLETKLGNFLPAGAELLEIVDTTALVAEVQILESEIGEVRVGQPVSLRLSAFPDRTFPAKAIEIAPAAETDKLGRATFQVRCAIDDASGVLRPGMTGAAKIDGAEQPLVALIARRLLRMIDPSLF